MSDSDSSDDIPVWYLLTSSEKAEILRQYDKELDQFGQEYSSVNADTGLALQVIHGIAVHIVRANNILRVLDWVVDLIFLYRKS